MTSYPPQATGYQIRGLTPVPPMNPPRDDNPLYCGARQVASTPDEIGRHHVLRYLWAGSQISHNGSVLDVGCGCGYGAALLSPRTYVGIDHSDEAINFARSHYRKWGAFLTADAASPPKGPYDAVVAFEIIEHLANHQAALEAWWAALRAEGRLFISIPQQCLPAKRHPFHLRDWTPAQLAGALQQAAFVVDQIWPQLPSGQIVRRPLELCHVHTVVVQATKPQS